MIHRPLFRAEVLAERQSQWLGTVLLAPRISHRLFAVFALATTAALVGLLIGAQYTRTERVSGWLVPEQGLVQVHAPQAGVVIELSVSEGAQVEKGDRLVVISTELMSAALGATQGEVARRLAARRDSLMIERMQLERLAAQQARALADRLAVAEHEEAQLDREIQLQRERVKLAHRAVRRQRRLHRTRLASDEQLDGAKVGRLDQVARLRELERSRIAAERERLAIDGQLADLPLKSEAERASLDRAISQVEQELAETEARREIVVEAPESGTVTAIQVERGGRANPGMPLFSLVPEGSPLVAQMFTPSRAAGFLRAGQRVLLRYEAYPFQKFGHYEGEVQSVSRSAVNPAELPAQLLGLTSLVGRGEPVYRVTAALARQDITAYGQSVPLQPGMQLEADVLLERRRLYEWILNPLYTLTGKWQP